jgi:hypothetical protein
MRKIVAGGIAFAKGGETIKSLRSAVTLEISPSVPDHQT